MPTCIDNYYFSGQGSLLVAERHTDGTPKAFQRIGNVPSLELAIEVTKFEHKESCSGQRAIDLTIVQEKNGTFTMTLENFTPFNLALAAWGDDISNAADAAKVETVSPWEYSRPHRVPGILGITSITSVTRYDAGANTALVVGTGATDDIYFDNDYGTFYLNSAGAVTGTAGSAGAFNFDGLADDVLTITASVPAFASVEALTSTSQIRWLRFEGLNTIDEKAVLIDMFKADLDPLAALPLINDEISSYEISGNLLFDNLQAGNSKVFTVKWAETSFDQDSVDYDYSV